MSPMDNVTVICSEGRMRYADFCKKYGTDRFLVIPTKCLNCGSMMMSTAGTSMMHICIECEATRKPRPRGASE